MDPGTLEVPIYRALEAKYRAWSLNMAHFRSNRVHLGLYMAYLGSNRVM